MQILPGLFSIGLVDRRYLVDTIGLEQGPDVTLDASNVDLGSTPTFRFRPGNVVVKVGATGRYVEADDPAGDRPEPATVIALETASATWQGSTITIQVDDGPAFQVKLGPADNTDALVVAALQKDARFQALCVADVVGARVRIRTLTAGAETTLKISSTVATAFGALGSAATGNDPDVLVTDDWADLRDENGVAIAALSRTLRRGHFSLSGLIVGGVAGGLRTQGSYAFAVLARRGSRFSP